MKLFKWHSPFLMLALVMPIFLACDGNQPLKDEDKQADKLIELAIKYNDEQKLDKAYYYYNQAKTVSNSTDNIVYSLIRIAYIQNTICDFTGSETTITEALSINTSPKYNYYLYNSLGIAYEEQSNFENALKYYNMSYDFADGALNKIIVKNNIGVVYLESQNYYKALSVYKSLIKEQELIKDKLIYAKVADNLGYCYFKLNRPEASQYLEQSFKIRDSIKDNLELIASSIHLAEFHQRTNPKLALSFAKRAYQSAKAINSPDDKIVALKFMIANSDPVMAQQLALKQITLSDSINKVRQSAKNQFAKIKYDTKKISQEKETYRKQKIWVLYLLAIVVLISILVYYFNRYKNIKKLKVSVYQTETRIAKKLHDELANDMFNALNYAETQDLQNPDNKEALLENLDKIYARTRDISRDNSEINTGSEYREYLMNLLNGYSTNQVNIIINDNNTIDWSKVKKESKISLYRVLQELMVNMKKHSDANVVIISFNSNSKYLQINYSDNGKGTDQITKSKKGLFNVENRIQAIKGTITFETQPNKGLKITMNIPM